MLTIYPSISVTAFALATLVTILGILGSVRAVRRRDWWGQMAFANSWLILLLAIAIRSWAHLAPRIWIWILLLGLAYAFAWFLPALYPRLSEVIAREQIAPETPIGRGCFTAAVAILPAAGGLGAAFALVGGQIGGMSIASLSIAVLFTAGTLAGAQLMAHQLWPRRPWAEADR